jgi:integrase
VRKGRKQLARSRWTHSLAEARAWRIQKLAKLDASETPQESRRTVSEAADAWIAGAKAGAIRNRKGQVYKPSTLRGYEEALNGRVIPTFGRERIGRITKPRLQRWIRTLLEDGLSASTVRNTVNAVRVLYRQAEHEGEVLENPTSGLRLPAVDRQEHRFVPAGTVDVLLSALPIRDRAIWATAFYAGLRRGELRGLRYGDVDQGGGIIRVRHNEDAVKGTIDPKSAAGRRVVPIPGTLAAVLDEYDAYLENRLGRSPREDERYFPGEPRGRFCPKSLVQRADEAWAKAGLDPVRLHDARHTYASLMIAAGVNAKALCTYMGHSTIQVTFDLYGHLLPGNEAEAADSLDTYLRRIAGGGVPKGVPTAPAVK